MSGRDDQVSRLHAELAALRRRVKALRWVLTGAGVGAVLAVVTMRRDAPGEGILRVKRVDAQEYRLLDREGHERGYLRRTRLGPSFSLHDEAGMARVALGGETPGLVLMDEAGRPRVRVELTAGGPRVALVGEDGRPRAELRLGDRGGGLRLVGPGGVRFERP